MAKRTKHFYYVGVMSNKIDDDTLRLVYETEYKTALFKTYKEIVEMGKKPMAFSKEFATMVADGLSYHGFDAFVIMTCTEYR